MSARATTSRNYANPFRPWPVKILNQMPELRSDRAIFDPDAFLNYAMKTTGETEWSAAPLIEPLSKLCTAICEEAQLSQFGRIVQATRLKTLLVNRLRLDALMREHAEILAQPTPDVIAITGLARTGTTLLHRTLASDPNARALPSWEALNPAPFPNETRGQPDKRVRLGERAARMMGWLAPDFSAVHPVSALEPEEDILLLDLTCLSQTAEAVMHVPSFSEWLETQDHTRAYEYLRDVLKTLNWLAPKKHWVLKTPNHSEQLDALLSVFPRATLVQTHRDPQRTFPSCCSLMAHSQALSSDHIDPATIGRHWLRKVARMADKAQSARATHRSARILDVQYGDLISDPLSVIEDIYKMKNDPVCTRRKDAITASLAAIRARPPLRHAYNLNDFGLNRSDIEVAFKDYRQRFNIPNESEAA